MTLSERKISSILTSVWLEPTIETKETKYQTEWWKKMKIKY